MNQASISIQKAISLVRQADSSVLTDRELLRLFSEEKDQDAFRQLVDRHTSLVFGVCRRSLPTEQDAEDATQATFLILARKAKKAIWQTSIANWLYSTARKVSLDARRLAQRRAKREGKASIAEVTQPIDQITGRELLTILDEELEKLPLIYREPLILCYLEGLSREEVSTRLAILEGTVKIRLERGRKKLGDAIAKRNVSIGIGLLTLAATSSSRASSTNLLERITSTVFDSPAKTVELLAKGVAMNGWNKVLGFGLAIGLAAILGIGLGSLKSVTAGQRKEKSMPEKNASEKEKPQLLQKEGPNERIVSGRVVGVDGKPIEGAELILFWLDRRPLQRIGKSGDDGTFRVTVPLIEPGAYLVAKAKEYAIDFIFPAKNTSAEVTFKLPKEQPIRGRVLDTQGKPVSGVEITVRRLQAFEKRTVDQFLKEWVTRHFQAGYPESDREMWLNGSIDTGMLENEIILGTKTDKEGHFDIRGLSTEQVATLRLRGGGIAEFETIVINRKDFDPAPHNQAFRKNLPRGVEKYISVKSDLYGTNPTFIAEPEKILRGVIKDRDTGKPRVGVEVGFLRISNSELVNCPVFATTDKEGRFELRGVKRSHTYVLEVQPDNKEGYMACQEEVQDTIGYEPIEVSIGVVKGIIVTGKMIDKVTRKPVPGQLSMAPLIDNNFAKKFPTFDRSASTLTKDGITKPDGTFRLVTIPGPVLLMGGPNSYELTMTYKKAVADPNYPKYFVEEPKWLGFLGLRGGRSFVEGNWCKVLELKDTDTVVTQDIELEPASQTKIRVLSPEGRLLSGIYATGIGEQNWSPPIQVDSDRVIAYNMMPKKERLMAFFDPKRKLVGSFLLKGEDKEPSVTLGSGGIVTGRIVDGNGKPIPEVQVHLNYENREVTEIHDRMYRDIPISTDRDGRFQFASIMPNQKFWLSFRQGKKGIGPYYKDAPKYVLEKHGDKRELGDLKTLPRSKDEEE